MLISKRDGRQVTFDQKKIAKAMLMAFNATKEYTDVDPLVAEVCQRILYPTSVEVVQDLVEKVLMRHHPITAKAYILYRDKRAQERKHSPHPDAISDYIFHSKYAKPGESWLDCSARCKNMHLAKYPDLKDHINHHWEMVDTKAVLPSMRSLQFAGQAMQRHNARMYNCSFTHLDSLFKFQQAFFLLLCGCGVGYSVQWQHVRKLPIMRKVQRQIEHYRIEDSIEGWADALFWLLRGHRDGIYIEFDYSQIRPEGVPVSSGGVAPGHLPLKAMLEGVRRIIPVGRMRPIHAHDIMCRVAEAVLSGGIRRSSLIALFSHNDTEMLYAKQGNFPSYRYMANNSAVLMRDRKSDFDHVMRVNQECFGEPGFFFTDNFEWGCNPCGEIGLDPGNDWDFCNLTEINAKGTTRTELIRSIRAASFIGTLQAGYDDVKVPYGKTRNLGISITGIADNEDVIKWVNPNVARLTNYRTAELIGIPKATRLTCIKPSGTTSLLLDTSSGIHDHFAKRYVRRITANPNEPSAQLFRQENPHAVEVKPNGDWCLLFPREGKEPGNQEELLERILNWYEAWVKPGSDGPLTHNVSCTITVTDWTILETVWTNRERIAAMTFVPISGSYPHMPMEINDVLWKELVRRYVHPEYDTGATNFGSACEGAHCEAQ